MINVNMIPNNDIPVLHCSEGDTEDRKFEVALHNNGKLIDASGFQKPLLFETRKGGTEQILPENGSVPVTAPFIGDIQYPDGLRTEQEFLYRESPTNEDGQAKITKIKGNTLVWNQIIGTPNQLNTTSGTTFSQNDDGSIHVTGTGTGNHFCEYRTVDHPDFNLITGHKYFVSFKGIISGMYCQVAIYPDGGSANYILNKTTDTEEILTITPANITASFVRFYTTSSYSGTTDVYMMAVDLTQMYGSGNEPTLAEFRSIFYDDYLNFCKGRLLSFGAQNVYFNQLVSNGDFASVSVWQTFGGATYTVSGNVGTVSVTDNVSSNAGRIQQNINYDSTHKYYYRATIKNNSPVQVKMWIGGDRGTWNANNGAFETKSIIFQTSTTGVYGSGARFISSYTGTYTYEIKNFIVIDLTQMFGKEIADSFTTKAFEQWMLNNGYTDDYFANNAGTRILLGSSIKATSKNVLDCTLAIPSAYNVILTTENGKIRVQYSGGVRYIGFGFFQKAPYANQIFLKRKYRLSFDVSGVDTGWTFGVRKVSNSGFVSAWGTAYFAQNGHYSVTLNFDEVTENVYLSASRTGNLTSAFDLTFSNVQLEVGETETAFVPYEESTLSLPISTYFPTGMKSAGSVYDEITESKAYTRVGGVDLGTLTYTRSSYNNIYTFSAQLLDVAQDNARVHTICANYETVPAINFSDLTDKKMRIWNNYVQIRDDSFTDATAFKTAMSGVMLYYELATPTETDITTASLVTEKGETVCYGEDDMLIVECNQEITSQSGEFPAKIKLQDGDGIAYSSLVKLVVEGKPNDNSAL